METRKVKFKNSKNLKPLLFLHKKGSICKIKLKDCKYSKNDFKGKHLGKNERSFLIYNLEPNESLRTILSES